LNVFTSLGYNGLSSELLRFQQPSGNITGDFQGFRNGTALGDQALDGIRCGQIATLRQLF
jgi:hypothetical protein